MNIFKTIHIFTGRLDTYMVSIIMLQTIIKQMFYEAKKKRLCKYSNPETGTLAFLKSQTKWILSTVTSEVAADSVTPESQRLD